MALTQTDSTYCFTQDEVKTFLRTKAELTMCLDSKEILATQLGELTDYNVELEVANEKTKKKLKRTRWIGAGGFFSAIVLTIIVLL